MFFQLILWLAPTFMWPGEPLPTPATPKLGEESVDTDYIENRIGPLVTNLGQSSAANIYNRLLCPQCVAQNLSVFALIVSTLIKLQHTKDPFRLRDETM